MRQVLAVIAGYVAMALFVMITFSVTWMALGSSFAFKGDSTRVTPGWISIALVLSVIAAVIGGWTAAKIGRSATAPRALAALVLVIGLALAVVHLTMTRPLPPKPISQLATFEAANYAVQPTWYDFSIPFVGSLFTLAGAQLASRRRATDPATA